MHRYVNMYERCIICNKTSLKKRKVDYVKSIHITVLQKHVGDKMLKSYNYGLSFAQIELLRLLNITNKGKEWQNPLLVKEG